MGGDMRVNAYFDIDLNLILSDRGAAQTIFHMSAEDAPRNVVVVPIQTCTQVRSCVAHANILSAQLNATIAGGVHC